MQINELFHPLQTNKNTHCKQSKTARCKQKKTSARARKYAANEMRGPGYEVVHVFSNMASFLRQEIKDAVKEEISRVLSTGEERSTGSDLPSSSRTEKQSKRERTLTFEEFYSLRGRTAGRL